MFTWSLAGVALEAFTSYDKLKLDDKGLRVYLMLMQHFARDNSGFSLARRKDATVFLRWIMSVIPDAAIQACYQSATGSKALEKRLSNVILNVYQSNGLRRRMVRGSPWRTMLSWTRSDGSRTRNLRRATTCIVTWLWRKATRDPRSEGSNSMCPV